MELQCCFPKPAIVDECNQIRRNLACIVDPCCQTCPPFEEHMLPPAGIPTAEGETVAQCLNWKKPNCIDPCKSLPQDCNISCKRIPPLRPTFPTCPTKREDGILGYKGGAASMGGVILVPLTGPSCSQPSKPDCCRPPPCCPPKPSCCPPPKPSCCPPPKPHCCPPPKPPCCPPPKPHCCPPKPPCCPQPKPPCCPQPKPCCPEKKASCQPTPVTILLPVPSSRHHDNHDDHHHHDHHDDHKHRDKCGHKKPESDRKRSSCCVAVPLPGPKPCSLPIVLLQMEKGKKGYHDDCISKTKQQCGDDCPECAIEIHHRTVYPKCEAMVPGYGGHVPGIVTCKFGKTFGRETREVLQKVFSTPYLRGQKKKMC